MKEKLAPEKLAEPAPDLQLGSSERTPQNSSPRSSFFQPLTPFNKSTPLLFLILINYDK